MEIIELNGFDLKLSGVNPVLIVLHQDQYGTVAQVASILAQYQINIGYMQVSRKNKGSQALMSIETDQQVDADTLDEIRALSGIYSVIVL